MDPALTSLIAANLAFAGTHVALSHPLRAPLIRMVGDKGFLGLYSLVAFAALGWIIVAFRQVGPGGGALWNGQTDLAWGLASLLTLISLTLVVGANKGNPAMPGVGAEAISRAEAKGVFAVTRHPMMWGFAIWALSHILISPTPRTIVTAGTMGALGLLGSHLQDRKKEALLGAAWNEWESRTSFVPRLGKLAGIAPAIWVIALVLWLALSWLHVWLAYVPAGIWRWL
jgi:uncharacterized membrane protein